MNEPLGNAAILNRDYVGFARLRELQNEAQAAEMMRSAIDRITFLEGMCAGMSDRVQELQATIDSLVERIVALEAKIEEMKRS